MKPFIMIAAIGVIVCFQGCSSLNQTEAKSKTYEYLAWLDHGSEGEFDPYRKILSEKIDEVDGEVVDPTKLDKYLDYLTVLDTNNKKPGTEQKIKDFVAKNPEEKRGLFVLGVHYMRYQKRELANYFFTLLEKDPNFKWRSLLYNNLGMLSLQEKDRDKAMNYFTKAIAAEPTIAAPRVNLGALYLQSKSYVEAQPLFRKALDIDGDFEDAVLGLGVCLESQGKFAEAHQLYSTFMDSHTQNVAVLYNDALILAKHLGKREEASEIMLRYIQRGGKEASKAHEMIQGWR